MVKTQRPRLNNVNFNGDHMIKKNIFFPRFWSKNPRVFTQKTCRQI